MVALRKKIDCIKGTEKQTRLKPMIVEMGMSTLKTPSVVMVILILSPLTERTRARTRMRARLDGSVLCFGMVEFDE